MIINDIIKQLHKGEEGRRYSALFGGLFCGNKLGYISRAFDLIKKHILSGIILNKEKVLEYV